MRRFGPFPSLFFFDFAKSSILLGRRCFSPHCGSFWSIPPLGLSTFFFLLLVELLSVWSRRTVSLDLVFPRSLCIFIFARSNLFALVFPAGCALCPPFAVPVLFFSVWSVPSLSLSLFAQCLAPFCLAVPGCGLIRSFAQVVPCFFQRSFFHPFLILSLFLTRVCATC